MKEPGFRNIFLFSVDLEDVRLGVENGMSYKERVPVNTHAYLNWLNLKKSKCTFFTTGQVARAYPSLINEIVSEGHEIGCHTTNHIPLDKQTPEEFKKDLEENISLLMHAGATNIEGFRAPILSLTKSTQWAYGVLKELRFKYSSSILPAKSPLYGWEDFGYTPRIIDHSIVEIPVTIGKLGPLTIPSAAGVYFRAIPKFLMKKMVAGRKAPDYPVIGYFHPYDIDSEQERFMHGGINNSKVYNWLMYYNRKAVFNKLNSLMDQGYVITTYSNFIKDFLADDKLNSKVSTYQ